VRFSIFGSPGAAVPWKNAGEARAWPIAVPELTRSACIKLNMQAALRHRCKRVVIYHRALPQRPGPPWRGRRSIIFRPTVSFIARG
jgi:hypothetical protein